MFHGLKKYSILIVAVALIVIGIGVITALTYQHKKQTNGSVVFSRNAMLFELWNGYKKSTIEDGSNRTVDRQQNNITTSEGHSYTMLRAVWMDDRDTFDDSWKWTKDNLQRTDKLFSWKYGPLPNGQYGIQTDAGGQNTASDGDSDIALSLLMAYSRWNEPKYLDEAKPIIQSIWKNEVVQVAGKPVLMADDLEKNSPTTVVVNPSYFAPYAYKIFAKVDPNNDWQGLADNSYDVLTELSTSKLDKATSSGLPPDWVTMNRRTGAITPPPGSNTTNYGYDAMRVTWRLALDYHWFRDDRAKQILQGFDFLGTQWQQNGKLYAGYAHDGTVTENYESPAFYGASIGYFTVLNPETAQDIVRTKLQKVYDPDAQSSVENLSYYDANWSWFGLALAGNALPNLTAN